MTARRATSSHNLLVFSDVHLGSELVQHTRPDVPTSSKASELRDRDLVALLDWYRTHPRGDKPWRLVIAGDFIDFVGMSVSPSSSDLTADLNEDERDHGLGGHVQHTVEKLRRVAECHAAVFAALARFLAADPTGDGAHGRRQNTLVIVRGNHDIDFHWPLVQKAFFELLCEHHALDEGAIEFADWFYYEPGVVYVEHGHQYDDFCSTEHLLHPVTPTDPHRSRRTLADILLRYVVRPTRGMTESGHEHLSAVDYVRFALRLGAWGMVRLGARFGRAIGVLISMWHEHMLGAAHWVKEEHERKMRLLSVAKKVSLKRLRALASLQRPPMTHSLFRLLAAVMVDRVALSLAALCLCLWIAFAPWTKELGILAAIAIPLLGLAGWLWRRSRGSVDASASLRERAARIGHLFPAAFVVMGHTHLPELRREEKSTYVNLGAWAEEDLPDGAAPTLPATRTHLVVESTEGSPSASLLVWETATGPRRFRTEQDAADDSPPSLAEVAAQGGEA